MGRVAVLLTNLRGAPGADGADGVVDAEAMRDTMAATLVAGANVTITPDDPGDTITIAASGDGGGGGATTLDGLSDVTAAAPADGDVLVYDAGSGGWVAATDAHVHDYGELEGTPTLTDASSLSSGMLGVDRGYLGGVVIVDYYKDVYGAANAWPGARPTARPDVRVVWCGPTDPGESLRLAGDIVELVG